LYSYFKTNPKQCMCLDTTGHWVLMGDIYDWWDSWSEKEFVNVLIHVRVDTLFGENLYAQIQDEKIHCVTLRPPFTLKDHFQRQIGEKPVFMHNTNLKPTQ